MIADLLAPEIFSALMSTDYMMSKAAFAGALMLLLVLVRRSRPKQRIIFNY